MLRPFSLDRVVDAVQRVKERLLRAAAALEAAGIPYAVVGDNAIAAWVTRVDESLVRTTRDVDILIRREDFDRVAAALASAGFVYRHVSKLDIFLDGPDARVGDSVHIVFANEKVREHEVVCNPDVANTVAADGYRVLGLEQLVQIKLTSFRDKDRMHLRDLISVGLVDASWSGRFPAELDVRLQELLATPEG